MKTDDIIQISSGVLRNVVGVEVGLGLAGVGYVSLYPTGLSGLRAEAIHIHSSQNVFMTVNKVPTTPVGAFLKASTLYEFALHPEVQTLGFIAVAASTVINVSLFGTR